jgi:hypothetical protein
MRGYVHFLEQRRAFLVSSSPKEAKPGCIRKTRGSGQINSESLVQPSPFIENKGLAACAVWHPDCTYHGQSA